jgi:hypothetical protein
MKLTLMMALIAALLAPALPASAEDRHGRTNRLEGAASDAEDTVRDKVGNDADDKMERKAKKAKRKTKRGMKRTGEKIESGAERTGDKIERAGDRVRDKVD